MSDITLPVYGGMFDSTSVEETVGGFPRGNKAVDSAFFAKMISCFYKDGVLGDSFAVSAGSGLNVTVGAGVAWIRGYMAWQKADTALTLVPGFSRILLRLNIAAGEFSLVATDAEPVNTESIRDLVLAEVSVPSSSAAVTAAMITDTRRDTAKCGVVTSTVDALETVSTAENANMLGGTAADQYLRRTGGVMTGDLRASSDATGKQVVRNIGYGTTLPDSLADGELFVLLASD